ncbi:hypothetical protein BU24DRAFT_463688 [Aaosphaeria arxii CBS 175.79]|uniref:AA1-like domain-containing protein n=1 Tax=Aaosphaeria arxii CBS 175.79 TaxID=1450172 RepID=A0A6A5XRM3_9PLEO|nr:uncharacterized protein BU24DRAFT_463688 [Aaosphaeria arxii CBS 175.79]KAF2014954.1 hypothetical protein BU24DRAFT_463688 [Aaosphaeria arxii CBS 175.79]
MLQTLTTTALLLLIPLIHAQQPLQYPRCLDPSTHKPSWILTNLNTLSSPNSPDSKISFGIFNNLHPYFLSCSGSGSNSQQTSWPCINLANGSPANEVTFNYTPTKDGLAMLNIEQSWMCWVDDSTLATYRAIGKGSPKLDCVDLPFTDKGKVVNGVSVKQCGLTGVEIQADSVSAIA